MPPDLTATSPPGPPFPAYPHEVVAVVLTVREGALHVLLWRRAQAPYDGRWALPGGGVRPDQRLREALAEHLDTKVHVSRLAWLEQVATHSKVDRDPRGRVLATAYLGLLPADEDPPLPDDSAWHPVGDLPAGHGLAFDHDDFVSAAVERLRAKLSYTNAAHALAPATFTVAALRDVVSAALGYEVDATNLLRVMTRRSMIERTGATARPSSAGGRPAAEYRFTTREPTVTDPFAVLKPPR